MTRASRRPRGEEVPPAYVVVQQAISTHHRGKVAAFTPHPGEFYLIGIYAGDAMSNAGGRQWIE